MKSWIQLATTILFCLVLSVGVGAQKRSSAANRSGSRQPTTVVKPKLPTAFGTYYESTQGLVPLPHQSDPTEPLKNDAKKQKMSLQGPVVIGEKPSFIMFLKEGTYDMDELRLLRLSRMTLGFAFTSSGADLELGGDPIRPAIEPIAGHQGMFRVKIQNTLSSDIYLFLEHYQKGNNINLNGRGYFKVE